MDAYLLPPHWFPNKLSSMHCIARCTVVAALGWSVSKMTPERRPQTDCFFENQLLCKHKKKDSKEASWLETLSNPDIAFFARSAKKELAFARAARRTILHFARAERRKILRFARAARRNILHFARAPR